MDGEVFIDLIGWAGAAMLLIAYFLVSQEKLSGKSVIYQILNLLGSACLIVNTVYYGAFPSAAVNIIWLIIAMSVLINMRRVK